MDGNNRKGGQAPMGQPQGGAVEQSASSGAPPMDPVDWKAQLTLDSRHRIVNKIAETLKRHLLFSGQEGLEDIKRIAVRFEEKIYSAATSQSDYLRKISLKMLNMEINSQSPTANSLQTNAANANVSKNSSDLGKGRIQSESAIGFMDGNNLRGGQVPMGQPQSGAVEQSTLSSSGSSPPMYPDDWRAQLPLDSSHKIVNNTKDTLKKGLPSSGQEQEGLQEIKKIVGEFEERILKIYSAATSQSDYLREISPKMLIMDANSESPTPNSLQTNAANASRNSSGLGKKRIRSESACGIMDGYSWTVAHVPMGQPQGGAVEQSALSSSGGAPPMDPNEWRAQLTLDSRHRIVNKMMETLKKHLLFPGQEEQEGLEKIKKIAVGFEEKIYSSATSLSDYLRNISLKMLTYT